MNGATEVHRNRMTSQGHIVRAKSLGPLTTSLPSRRINNICQNNRIRQIINTQGDTGTGHPKHTAAWTAWTQCCLHSSLFLLLMISKQLSTVMGTLF